MPNIIVSKEKNRETLKTKIGPCQTILKNENGIRIICWFSRHTSTSVEH